MKYDHLEQQYQHSTDILNEQILRYQMEVQNYKDQVGEWKQ